MMGGPNTSMAGLHDILFQQLERISNEDLKGDALKEELTRSETICDIASQIINAGDLVVKVARLNNDLTGKETELGYLVEQPTRKIGAMK